MRNQSGTRKEAVTWARGEYSYGQLNCLKRGRLKVKLQPFNCTTVSAAEVRAGLEILENQAGGGGGNRTRGRAFAELGLTTWRPRQLPIEGHFYIARENCQGGKFSIFEGEVTPRRGAWANIVSRPLGISKTQFAAFHRRYL